MFIQNFYLFLNFAFLQRIDKVMLIRSVLFNFQGASSATRSGDLFIISLSVHFVKWYFKKILYLFETSAERTYPLRVEAPPRFELGIRVLQTHALPLGYSAEIGADYEARTRYLHLGKVALYQMS